MRQREEPLEERLRAIIYAQPVMIEALERVAALQLSDWMIGAGFVRNAVWAALRNRTHNVFASDVDVMHFGEGSRERDHEIEQTLLAAGPIAGVLPRWDVKDQSRMHERFGYAPYRSSYDALAAFPETCTCVAARLAEGRLEIIAPYGVEDLFSLRIRRSPGFRGDEEMYRERVRKKFSAHRWLRFDAQ